MFHNSLSVHVTFYNDMPCNWRLLDCRWIHPTKCLPHYFVLFGEIREAALEFVIIETVEYKKMTSMYICIYGMIDFSDSSFSCVKLIRIRRGTNDDWLWMETWTSKSNRFRDTSQALTHTHSLPSLKDGGKLKNDQAFTYTIVYISW